MIAYDLRCEKGHVFEGWFARSDSFEEQKEKGILFCPFCSSTSIEKLPSTFSIGRKVTGDKTKEGEPKKDTPLPPMTALMSLKRHIEESFEDVGPRFSEEAIKIHYGEIEKKSIRGTSTEEEEKELREEGIPFVKIPILRFQS